MTRRFVAIGVDPRLRDALDAQLVPLRAAHPELVWTDPAGWHVTLAFVGELADERVADVTQVVRGAVVPGGPRRLRVERVARLGGAVVLRVGDTPAGWVAELGGDIQAGLEQAGLPVQVREVRPHLTLARARRGRSIPAALIADLDAVVGGGSGPWAYTPHDVGVWASHPRSGPARYEREAVVALSG